MESESRVEGAPVGADGASVEAGGEARLARIEAAVREGATGFAFFQAVRLLERLRPERAVVGEWEDPGDEVVRFAVPPRFAFPPGEIRSLEMDGTSGQDGAPARMEVNFMGLVGPQGVLPLEYTHLVADRYRSRDRALGEFLDLFHHRMISLFYQGWRKSRLDLHFQEEPGEVSLVRHLLDLLGLGLGPYMDRQTVPDETLIYYAGLLAPQPRGAGALKQLLEDRMGVTVAVEEFVGGWFRLDPRDRCHLGAEAVPTQLGSAVVGDEVWDQQSKVRLRVGPLDRGAFDAFLPGGEKHEELKALVRFFSHDQFDFEVQLVLRSEEVPGLVLGSDEAQEQPLGWCTWLRSRPRERDADETVLAL